MKALTLETGNNISAGIKILDDSFYQLNQRDCNLAILISPGEISYSILDNVHNKVVSLTSASIPAGIPEESATLEAIRLLTEDSLFQWDFNKVKIAVDTGNNTLIPHNLFDPNQKETYLAFNTSPPADHSCYSDYLAVISVHNVYSSPAFLIQSVKSLFDRPRIMHGSTPFINKSIRENQSSKEDNLFVHYSYGRIDMVALKKGEFVFFNSFPVKTKEDFTYFLLASCEELGFNPELIHVVLSGNLPVDLLFYESAGNYLKNLSLDNRPKAFKYSSKLDVIPVHHFSNLFSINLCE